ncbi:MAG: DUF4865 family protein [Alphaproteobacteria bacterium]|nr:DUF4865 family protein [Alphaproteobacteria bacterium]
MFAMQYRIPLPRSFDMAEIRNRVAAKGSAYDELPGLRRKAFLARDIETAHALGRAANEYASFYVWDSLAAARAFLLGQGFAGIVESFGRPTVQTWLVVAAAFNDAGPPPRFALKESLPLPETLDLRQVTAAEQAELALIQDRPGLRGWVSALDPSGWTGIRFSLWESAEVAEIPAAADLVGWEVLHLSAPAAATTPGPAPDAAPLSRAAGA